MKRVRTLIVDDSSTMRSLIAAVLRRDPEIEIVGQAADPLEARQAIKALDPDVITLDVEMPNMSGLDFLEKIMRLRPMPVVMVSSHTQSGADATLEALALGAVDYVAKPADSDFSRGFAELSEKVKAAARAQVRPPGLRAGLGQQPERRFAPNGRLVAIGASAGGVEALMAVISRYPANCPPTVIAQHMPAAFTRGFAERLNRICAAEVAEAFTDAPLLPGRVYLAPGDSHLEISGRFPARCVLQPADYVKGPRPSVDVLMQSVAATSKGKAVGVILTGMGRDGTAGLLAMRRSGARTIAQDQATSVVYGMPRSAAEAGAAEIQLPLELITTEILALTDALSHVKPAA
jgi:two-component system chemotaxis response regulator CheB